MRDQQITITATDAEWRAVLRAVPRCVGCGGLAEVELGGRPRCVGCAAPVRRSRCKALPHAPLAMRIEDALSHHLPRARG